MHGATVIINTVISILYNEILVKRSERNASIRCIEHAYVTFMVSFNVVISSKDNWLSKKIHYTVSCQISIAWSVSLMHL